tara:strand:+ start:6259 stop:6948 length:690 start_codon:yes stop_codon:yes gene_type:complete
MNVITNKIDYYINLLKTDQKFSFTRWGDGEWGCLFGEQGQNCDGHEFFKDLSHQLLNVFTKPLKYYIATWPMDVPMMRDMDPQLRSYVQGLDIKFQDATIWEEAAMAGKLAPLVTQLESMNFVMISESTKRNLPMDIKEFIDIPSKNCFLEKERIKQDILNILDKYKNPVFGFSASMATNVIVDELFDEIGDKCWMIDFGSIWEPFLKIQPGTGKHSRTYHRQYKTREL